MTLQEDAIVDISKAQEGYFGGPGRMLLPCPATVEALVKRVPEGKLLTTDRLRKMLADQFEVQGTCPVTTKKALQAIADDSNSQTQYWRIIKQNGELNAAFPGGVEGQAVRLRDEGFTITSDGKAPRVKDFKSHIAHLD